MNVEGGQVASIGVEIRGPAGGPLGVTRKTARVGFRRSRRVDSIHDGRDNAFSVPHTNTRALRQCHDRRGRQRLKSRYTSSCGFGGAADKHARVQHPVFSGKHSPFHRGSRLGHVGSAAVTGRRTNWSRVRERRLAMRDNYRKVAAVRIQPDMSTRASASSIDVSVPGAGRGASDDTAHHRRAGLLPLMPIGYVSGRSRLGRGLPTECRRLARAQAWSASTIKPYDRRVRIFLNHGLQRATAFARNLPYSSPTGRRPCRCQVPPSTRDILTATRRHTIGAVTWTTRTTRVQPEWSGGLQSSCSPDDVRGVLMARGRSRRHATVRKVPETGPAL